MQQQTISCVCSSLLDAGSVADIGAVVAVAAAASVVERSGWRMHVRVEALR